MRNSHLAAISVSTFVSKGSRPAQEDHILCDQEKNIFIVADGFGGPVPGSTASKMACEAVRTFLFKEAGDLEATLPFHLRSYFSLPGNVLFNAFIHANRKLTAHNKGKNVHECGGASVIAGFMDGDLLAIANAGVCTAWLYREGKAIELVAPRSYAKLCDPFLLEALAENQVPLMALGLVPDLEPEIFEVRLRSGDWVVFATDGVSPRVMSQISGIKQTNSTPKAVGSEFTEMLKKEEFKDNCALSLVIF